MKYKHCFFVIPLFLFHSFVFAHNTQQSSFNFFLANDDSFVEIILSQYGIEQALTKKYPKLDLKLISQKEFKELLVNELKQSISVVEDGKPLKISTGLIKLGSHQTDVKFKVEGFKVNPKKIDIKISSFQENETQNNFVTVEYNELSAKVRLNKKNAFQAKYIFNELSIDIE